MSYNHNISAAYPQVTSVGSTLVLRYALLHRWKYIIATRPQTELAKTYILFSAEKREGRFSEESSHEPAYEGAGSDKAGDLQALTSASDREL